MNGFLAEAESFAELVQGDTGQWEGPSPEESMDIAATLEAILQSARSGEPAAL
jgi:predicted dehydrogenase